MEKLIVYPEGLRLTVEYMPSFRSVAAGILVGAGSANESKENNGISHFIEHMIFKGTDKLSAFDIANQLEKMGAIVNAFTGKECTCYYVKTIDEYLEPSVKILSDIFFDSVFDSEEMDRERKVVLEEINMTEDSPEDICYDLISKAAYKEHPLARTILGSKENVSRFNKTDIQSYMNQRYLANNVVISMAGNITIEDADKIVRKYILPRFSTKKLQSCPPSEVCLHNSFEQRIKDFEQSNIALSFPSIKFNDSKYAVQSLVNLILGGGMSSRLFQNIREKQGLAYSVYSAPSSFKDVGTFNIYLNISEQNTFKAIDSTLKELDNLISNGITEEEFTRAKLQLKAACVFSQESTQSVMTSLGKLMVLAGEVYDIDKRLAAFNNVTIEEANEFVRSIFSSKNVSAAYVGKHTTVDIEKLIKR